MGMETMMIFTRGRMLSGDSTKGTYLPVLLGSSEWW